jgi:aspartyl-tRNA(Asn)/glutamyl-tRNA(Gln) amidotransferase subunit C
MPIMPEPAGSESLSEETVRKVARLSRLTLDDAEVRDNAVRLSAVLGYIDRLSELDLTGIEPMSNPLDAANRTDADEPVEGLPTATLMDLAPDSHPPFVKVPKVLPDGGGA